MGFRSVESHARRLEVVLETHRTGPYFAIGEDQAKLLPHEEQPELVARYVKRLLGSCGAVNP